MYTYPEFVHQAYILLRRYWYLRKYLQGEKMLSKKPPTTAMLYGIPGGDEEAKEFLDRTLTSIVDLLKEASQKYNYVAFLLDTKLNPYSVLAVLANPPDLTISWDGGRPLVKPGSYISVSLVVTSLSSNKRHEPLVAKYFTTLNFTTFYMGKVLQAGGLEKLRMFFESKVSEYVSRGKSKKIARTFAVKDVLRVHVGGAWLIAVTDMLDLGIVEPGQVSLPYELVNSPNPVEHAKSMLQPVDVVPTQYKDLYRGYSWPRLVERLTKQ